MNSTSPTWSQVAAPVGNWDLNTTNITTTTSNKVGSSLRARNCLGPQRQVPACSWPISR